MKPREFYDAVVAMRKAQQKYFQTRKTFDLIEAKKLEAVIDEEIDRVSKILDARAAADALHNGNTMRAAESIVKHFKDRTI